MIIKNTSENLLENIVSYDIFKIKPRLKTESVLRPNENLYFNAILGLSPNWYFKTNIENISQNKVKNLKQTKFIQTEVSWADRFEMVLWSQYSIVLV